MEDFEKLSCLGQGAFGEVWKCWDKKSESLVAIKVFKGFARQEQIVRELLPLRLLSHDNLLKAKGWFIERRTLYGIFELLHHSVKDELKACDKGLDSDVLREYTFQILQGAHFLHSKNIMHRDIKPDNILVSRHGVVKLADLGLARRVDATSVRLSCGLGTRTYMAPELLLLDRKYSKSVDVWALGCTVLVMARGRSVFRPTCYLDVVRQIVAKIGPLTKRQQHQYDARCPEELTVVQNVSEPTEKYKVPDKQLAGFIEACLQMHPADRFSCSELLGHDYFIWDHFPNNFIKDMEFKVRSDREERHTLRKPQPQASCDCGKTGTQPTSTPPDNATPPSQPAAEKVVTPPSQPAAEKVVTQPSPLQDVSQGMVNLEEAQDEPPQTGGNVEPAEEVKKKKKRKKKGFRALLRRAAQAIRRCFTSCVSPVQGG